MASCRDCKLYDLDTVKDKAGRVRKDRVARCLWKSTEVWPVSVREHMATRPTPGYMAPNDGDRCGRFIKRTPA